MAAEVLIPPKGGRSTATCIAELKVSSSEHKKTPHRSWHHQSASASYVRNAEKGGQHRAPSQASRHRCQPADRQHHGHEAAEHGVDVARRPVGAPQDLGVAVAGVRHHQEDVLVEQRRAHLVEQQPQAKVELLQGGLQRVLLVLERAAQLHAPDERLVLRQPRRLVRRQGGREVITGRLQCLAKRLYILQRRVHALPQVGWERVRGVAQQQDALRGRASLAGHHLLQPPTVLRRREGARAGGGVALRLIRVQHLPDVELREGFLQKGCQLLAGLEAPYLVAGVADDVGSAEVRVRVGGQEAQSQRRVIALERALKRHQGGGVLLLQRERLAVWQGEV
mmetsp:Transcript_42007/g.106362  ORF Transcript_42007/g.106362 Transcript_42007/m.106362 type:complete len:337 (+) Transcript_42007:77-1087(+)